MAVFALGDVEPAVSYGADPFEDRFFWRVKMPYGPGFGVCWTVADERPSLSWVLEQITTVARRTSYEVCCGRMLGGGGMRLRGERSTT